jgi:hypothetical protein
MKNFIDPSKITGGFLGKVSAIGLGKYALLVIGLEVITYAGAGIIINYVAPAICDKLADLMVGFPKIVKVENTEEKKTEPSSEYIEIETSSQDDKKED